MQIITFNISWNGEQRKWSYSFTTASGFTSFVSVSADNETGLTNFLELSGAERIMGDFKDFVADYCRRFPQFVSGCATPN